MSGRDPDSYLWDRSGEPDLDVVALERLLARYGHGRAAPATPRPRRRLWIVLPLAAAVLAGAFWVAQVVGTGPRVFDGDGVRMVVADGRIVDEDGGGFRVATPVRLELVAVEAGEERWVGDLVLAAGSRAGVDTLGRDVTRLVLHQGRLEANVSVDASPRFFQVDTPSARCIDLGCRYALEVDPDGDAHVAVTFGQIAFTAADGGERFVPQGAECTARRGLGLGTPRFPAVTAGFDARLDALDRAAGAPADQRRALAERLAAVAADVRDTLALWHLLDDADAVVRAFATRALQRIAGLPPLQKKVVVKGAVFSRAEWREHLEELWW